MASKVSFSGNPRVSEFWRQKRFRQSAPFQIYRCRFRGLALPYLFQFNEAACFLADHTATEFLLECINNYQEENQDANLINMAKTKSFTDFLVTKLTTK